MKTDIKSLRIKSRDERVFAFIAYPSIALLALICLIPFWLIISASFTDNTDIMVSGYTMWPGHWSMTAYQYIFAAPKDVLRSYIVTIGITVVGTFVGLILTTMAGYVLNRKDFKYRNRISFFIYFTTLFSGGMIPSYILMVTVLQLKNTYAAVVLPVMLSPFLIILMRNFMKSIPDALIEAGKIDSAGDLRIFTSIVFPLSGPAIATVGLFLALGYWNNWYLPMIYLTKADMYPLQYYLYNILTAQQSAQQTGVYIEGMDRFPGESIKMAMAVVATGPILFLYPFVQRFFVRGITIGAVKG